MNVSRRALILGAGAMGTTLPFQRSFSDPKIKEYRLNAEANTVNLTGHGHPDTAVWADIWAVLSFIESTWPPNIRERQQRMNQQSQ
jgi:hypothetical protein